MTTCGWTVDVSCVPGWDDLTPEQQDTATMLAVTMLDRLTAFQFGQCPVTVRPCSPRCSGFTGYRTWPVGQPGVSGAGSPWMIPYVDNGTWRNCGCNNGCSCRARCEIEMDVPVAEIIEVSIDGAILDPAAYRLDREAGRGPLLVRTDGDCWPECQDMNVTSGVGVFTVEYRPGYPLPQDAPFYAGRLAGEFARACLNQPCALPAQMQSLVRDGVDVQILDPGLVPENILTGLADVDRWVRSVNPANLRQRPRVLSLDQKQPRVVS